MNVLLKRMLLLPVAVFGAALLVVLLSLVAGRWDLPFFWAYASVYALLAVVGFLTVDPDLLRERMRSDLRDRSLLVITAKLASCAHLIVAGLDVGRYHWSDTIPILLRIIGLGGFAAGFAVAMWAMAVNRFFIPTVRIQTERGHHLITAGPYRYVRHPGYTGVIIGVLCSCLALGSWLAAIPMVCLAGGILWRVVIEDRFLAERLDGYVEYTDRVPFRLLPRVW